MNGTDINASLDLLISIRPSGFEGQEAFLAQTSGAGSEGPAPYGQMPAMEALFAPARSGKEEAPADALSGYLDVLLAGDNKFVVTPGVVIERIPVNIAGDALADPPVEQSDSLRYHEVDGLLEEGGDPVEYDVVDGAFIYVRVNVSAKGRVTAATLQPAASEVKGVHYIPAVGVTAGSEGTYYYLLAKTTIVAGAALIEPVLAGANIEHFAELPTMKTPSGASILKQFNAETGEYEFKGVTAEFPLTVVPLGDELLHFAFGGEGDNFDIWLTECTIDVDPNEGGNPFSVVTPESSWGAILHVRGGMLSRNIPEGALPSSEVDYVRINARISGQSGFTDTGPWFKSPPGQELDPEP